MQARPCWPKPLLVRQECPSTQQLALSSWRCLWALAPPASGTCSRGRVPMLPASSSSMNSTALASRGASALWAMTVRSPQLADREPILAAGQGTLLCGYSLRTWTLPSCCWPAQWWLCLQGKQAVHFCCRNWNTLPCLLKELAGPVVHIQSILLLHGCGLPAHWVQHCQAVSEDSIMLSMACKVKSSCTLWVIRVTDKQLSRELGMRLPLAMCRVGTHHQSAADRDGWV